MFSHSLLLLSVTLDSAGRAAHKILPLHNGVIHPSYAPTPVPLFSSYIVSYTVSMVTSMTPSEITAGLNNMTSSGALAASVREVLPTIGVAEFNAPTGSCVLHLDLNIKNDR